jgi:two-component system sensor histidine kinase YesM
LRNTIETMDLAHPNLTLNDTDSDEIKLLQKSFTKMMERLDESIHQQTQMQLAEMRSYQMALQSQITPHFLYNTLNTIAAMAKEGGNETIVSTCHNLSKMLRYSSNYDLPKVSLADELAHAIQYLTLLKTRYEELLEYTWSSEGPTDSIEVPRLIIQPLVENSYQHGLSRIAPPWIVSVKVRAWEDGSFKVSVTDNGAGFSAEALDTLDEQIAFMHEGLVTVQKLRCLEGKHVGLINTYSRLFLEYGEDVDLAVVNNTPGHCSVEIFVRKGKKRDLSHNDCRR